MTFFDEIGLHLSTYMYDGISMKDIIGIAEIAQKAGMNRIWINDNLRYWNPFVCLSSIASHVEIPLGFAVLVPYFRNPVDTAGGLAALGELAFGRREFANAASQDGKDA